VEPAPIGGGSAPILTFPGFSVGQEQRISQKRGTAKGSKTKQEKAEMTENRTVTERRENICDSLVTTI